MEKREQGNVIRLLVKHLRATHISDETGPDNIHILPYTGLVDGDDVLRSLAEIDYSGPFAFEIQHYLPRMPMELIPAAMEFSVTIGNHMLAQLTAYKREHSCE